MKNLCVVSFLTALTFTADAGHGLSRDSFVYHGGNTSEHVRLSDIKEVWELKREQFNQLAHDKSPTRSGFVVRPMVEDLIITTRQKIGATEEVGVAQDAPEDIIRDSTSQWRTPLYKLGRYQRGHQEGRKVSNGDSLQNSVLFLPKNRNC